MTSTSYNPVFMESKIEINETFRLAETYLNETNENLFVTGNAGTGKTSFLRHISRTCPKNIVIAASTGIAAINAVGITLHSLFQLPLAPFIPTPENKNELIKSTRLSKTKIQLIRQMEVLIIDEVSMVRADVLDALDTLLKSIRKSHNQPFGGVQTVFIGDLNQLPPVTKRSEWSMLSPYYNSPYFFEAKVIMDHPPILIKFKKIYRQQNQAFINLLNDIRNNSLSDADLQLLNQRYIPGFHPPENTRYITLTSHNSLADEINLNKLNKLDGNIQSFEAEIEGDFPENQYPCEKILNLKIGAQVMFLKNDSVNHLYFNGKIGIVQKLDASKVTVLCDELEIEVSQDTWENNKYSLHPDNGSIRKETVGTFTQLPLRLAWAITIHKSQGLTFDHVMVDAGLSFSSGQVYVALSRCTSLEGIILLSKINREAIIYDGRVKNGIDRLSAADKGEEFLQQARNQYFIQLLISLFNLKQEIKWVSLIMSEVHKFSGRFSENSLPFWQGFYDELITANNIMEKFILSLHHYKNLHPVIDENTTLLKRIYDACHYFLPIMEKFVRSLTENPTGTESKEAASGINDLLNELHLSILWKKHLLKNSMNHFSIIHFHQLKKSFSRPDKKLSVYNRNVGGPSTEADNLLYRRLKIWRDRLVTEHNLPVYLIGTSEMLKNLTEMKPRTANQLKLIKGMGAAKIARYGNDILEIINNYYEEFDIAESNFSEFDSNPIKKNNPTKGDDALKKNISCDMDKIKKTSHTHIETLNLWNQHRNISAIAQIRGLTNGTIEEHLIKLSLLGKVTLDEWIPSDHLTLIREIVGNNMEKTLKELKLLLPEEIPYNHIKAIKEELQHKNRYNEYQ